jgi:hypothetical protein
MATWTFADGTELSSGGKVTGTGEFAGTLRDAVRNRTGVRVFPIPMPETPLDPASDYMLDLLAKTAELRPETDYEPTIDDLPPAILEELLAYRHEREDDETAEHGWVQ